MDKRKRRKYSNIVLYIFLGMAAVVLAALITVIGFFIRVANEAEGALGGDARTLAVVLLVLLFVALAAVLVSGVYIVRSFKKAAERAESVTLAKGSYLSRMSHEMRTPMNAISGLSRMARETEDVAKKNEYLDNIGVASKHLVQIINDILDLSEIESGKRKQDRIEVDLSKELDAVEAIVRPQAESRAQTLTFSLDESIPGPLICDPTLLRQVLVNILSNAVKFTPEGGKVSLTCDKQSATAETCELRFCIKDTGIGMSAEAVDKLFKPFEQGNSGTARRHGGTGMGLIISKQMIEMMDGTISVTSKKGLGTEFVFTVKLLIPGKSVKAEGKQSYNYSLPDLKDKTFLLVEDAELNRMIAVNLFEGYGATVEVAKNGLEGYQMFCRSQGKYDIIFMDIQMPVMDGYESAMKIRTSGLKQAAKVPIIAMTANVFKEDVQRALDAGMNAHVGKPFETEEIERAIAGVLTA